MTSIAAALCGLTHSLTHSSGVGHPQFGASARHVMLNGPSLGMLWYSQHAHTGNSLLHVHCTALHWVLRTIPIPIPIQLHSDAVDIRSSQHVSTGSPYLIILSNLVHCTSLHCSGDMMAALKNSLGQRVRWS